MDYARYQLKKAWQMADEGEFGGYHKLLTNEVAMVENFAAALQKKYADVFKNPEEFVRLGNEIVAIPVKPSIKQQLNQAKKEQSEREDKKPPSHKPPEL